MNASLKTAIAQYVDGMKAAGIVIKTNAAAITLASKHPDSGMGTQEIISEIEEVVARVGARLVEKSGS